MADEAKEIVVKNNEAAHRFEVQVGGHLAVAAYRREGDKIIFTHTEVPDELEGHGIASTLIQNALATAREQHLSVVPQCPFVASYIRRHQEYLDLVQPEFRERLSSK